MLSIRSRLDPIARTVGLWFMLLPLGAQEVGIPAIRNFSPKEYGGDAQNWAITQGPRGRIFVANNQGVLVYDGVRWSLIPTPGRTTVRSLATDAEGRTFVGAVGELGYLGKDASGRLGFVSLLGRLPAEDRAFSDVWTARATGRGVLFQTREQLMLYRDGVFRVWKAQTTFHVAFTVGDRIFVRQRGIGLEELKGGVLNLVPGGERFANESVFALLPMKGGILVASRNQGLWKLTGDALTPFPSEVDAKLKGAALYSGAVLQDGTLALATTQGGILAFDESGKLRLTLNQASGLIGDNVKAIYPDGHGFLWLALDNGLARVEWPTPFEWLDRRQGLKGTIWAMMRHEGRLYAATGQGAYALEAASDGGLPAFTPIANSQAQCLSFCEMEGHLLLANARGVFEIQGDKAVPVRPSSSVTISFLRSRHDPSRLFIGLQGGLASMRWSKGVWLDEGLIPGVTDDIYNMGEDADGRLWLGTGAQGVVRVTFPMGWSGGAASPPPQVDHFGPPQGLPSSNQIVIVDLPGGLAFATHGGFYRFVEASALFAPDPRFTALSGGASRWVKTIAKDADGRLWMDVVNESNGTHQTGVATLGVDARYHWDPSVFRRVSDMDVEAIYPEGRGLVWLGGPEGILRYDGTVPHSEEPPFPALITSVSTKDGTALPPDGNRVALPFARNALSFEFAAPGLDPSPATRFQVLLEGFDHAWGPWNAETRKEYTNLHEGPYRFRVRARNADGRESGEAVFAFQVQPPWYRAWWAWLLWALGAVAVITAVIRIRTRILKQRNARLESRIAEATEELREREQMLAHQAADLERVNRDLKVINEQKDQYLGLVVHDLRNPLNGILLSAEVISEESGEPEIRALAGRIRDTGTDMNGLIGRFLDIAAIDAGNVLARLEAFPMEMIVREAATAFGPEAAKKGIELATVIQENAPEAWVDPAFAKEIFENLTSNALKFSPGGKTVTLRLEHAGPEVVLSVEDQGPGLTEEDKQRLFGRFARLTAQPTGGEPSVGLGLSIVKHMVDACGGRIWVDSAPGEGAAFRVAFKRA
ncbi:MAG: hypothetical protein JST05_02280 [Acidobacteria bacterium]|nr:hypothetical protein [Acidobacteriota bacterium]